MYVDDLISLLLMSLDRFDKLPDMINVGLGYDYTINEYYQAAARVLGWEGEFSHDLSKPVGMRQKLLNVEKAKALGWKATASLEEGIRHTYQFFIRSLKD